MIQKDSIRICETRPNCVCLGAIWPRLTARVYDKKQTRSQRTRSEQIYVCPNAITSRRGKGKGKGKGSRVRRCGLHPLISDDDDEKTKRCNLFSNWFGALIGYELSLLLSSLSFTTTTATTTSTTAAPSAITVIIVFILA